MATTAWRFSGTEGADEAILKLKQLEAAKLVEVQDVTVIRWPQYAAEPTVREHVTEEGSKLIRSDLSVQEQDEVWAALNSGDADQPQPPGNVPES